MRRSRLFRVVASLVGIFFGTALAAPPALHACPDGMAHHQGGSAHAMDMRGGSPGVSQSSDDGHHAVGAPHAGACCCMGACCCGGVAELFRADGPAEAFRAVHTPIVRRPASSVPHPAAPPHARPFANAPPDLGSNATP